MKSDSGGPVVTLSIVEGPGTGARYRYDERATAILGRADDCNPRIDPEPGANQLVSRHHCLFDINPPDIRVRDFGSLNGTYVNGEEIGRRQPGQTPEEGARLMFRERDLVDGDRITLGYTVIQVGVAVPPAPTLPGTVLPRACSACGGSLTGDSQGTLGEAVCARCQSDRGRAIDALLGQLAPTTDALPEISGYELVKKLGDGGQGVVYLARSQSSGEVVAVKMLLAKVAVKERSRAMFEREIVNIKSLNHPYVVGFRESGRVGAAWFFTTEYCAGGSMEDLLQRDGLLRPDRAVPLVVQALEGLAYAHTAPLPNGSFGLVHRDIKPGNILLARHGPDLVAKVADFGLSKAFDRAGLSGMTLTGSVAGTMQFMARPQLIDYKHAQPDVDVWSMAASLYFMLTGHYPRTFPKREDPIRVVLDSNAVPIRERDSTIPRRLAAVIDEALIDRPQITVASAAQLAGALREAL
ncbi:MAG: protein kinase [Mycobacterium sp.]|uniref:protein kinase domain-containing protein n=1 Tax=Mycobacterium sp. TaxID=1785 RepID=UPI001EC11DAF|nr:protein kinase [Mycobacterium sp.]MBW0017068.1 protein kinase [Mycobacterium sp.]